MQHQVLRGKTQKRIVKAEGCNITDDQGKTYLDALAGLWCVNVGYGRKELAAVAQMEMEKLSYLAPIMACDAVLALAEKLKNLLGFESHVYFSVSGSEANEAAFKIVRQYQLQSGKPGEYRYKIISRYRAYHGNTMGAMAATGQAERKIGYDPFPPGFVHIMPPYHYRANPTLTPEEHGEECAKSLEETIIHEGPKTVAAFIMEPVISGGGILVPPDNYIPRVREICDEYGVLLIFDEVVSGFGRTGSMFGYQHWNTEADVFTFAKGLASGYMPIAATVVKEHVFEKFYGDEGGLNHFRQINTYGSHPVAAAVGLQCLKIVEEENLVGNAQRVGEYIRANLHDRLRDHPYVGEIRGKGLLIGVELVSDKERKKPVENVKIAEIVSSCMEHGVIVGRNSNTVPGRCNILVMAPPLILTIRQADVIIDAVCKSLERAIS